MSEELLYGEPYKGSASTALQCDYQTVRLFTGSSSFWNGNRHEHHRLASFEMLGFSVKITDQDACNTILSLVRVSASEEEMAKTLQPFLLSALVKDPEAIQRLTKKAFNAGVEEGRYQKVKELRNVFEL